MLGGQWTLRTKGSFVRQLRKVTTPTHATFLPNDKAGPNIAVFRANERMLATRIHEVQNTVERVESELRVTINTLIDSIPATDPLLDGARHDAIQQQLEERCSTVQSSLDAKLVEARHAYNALAVSADRRQQAIYADLDTLTLKVEELQRGMLALEMRSTSQASPRHSLPIGLPPTPVTDPYSVPAPPSMPGLGTLPFQPPAPQRSGNYFSSGSQPSSFPQPSYTAEPRGSAPPPISANDVLAPPPAKRQRQNHGNRGRVFNPSTSIQNHQGAYPVDDVTDVRMGRLKWSSWLVREEFMTLTAGVRSQHPTISPAVKNVTLEPDALFIRITFRTKHAAIVFVEAWKVYQRQGGDFSTVVAVLM